MFGESQSTGLCAECTVLSPMPNTSKEPEQEGNKQGEPWSGEVVGMDEQTGSGQMVALYCVLVETLKVSQGAPELLGAHFKKGCPQ